MTSLLIHSNGKSDPQNLDLGPHWHQQRYSVEAMLWYTRRLTQTVRHYPKTCREVNLAPCRQDSEEFQGCGVTFYAWRLQHGTQAAHYAHEREWHLSSACTAALVNQPPAAKLVDPLINQTSKSHRRAEQRCDTRCQGLCRAVKSRLLFIGIGRAHRFTCFQLVEKLSKVRKRFLICGPPMTVEGMLLCRNQRLP
jgi:hypothetical protein